MGRRPAARGLVVLLALCCASVGACSSGGTGTDALPTPTTSRPTAPLAQPVPGPSVTATAKSPRTAKPVPSVTATRSSVGPSGLAMPKGDLPGWDQVLADGFGGKALGEDWVAYSGQPGGDPDGWWEPSHTTVSAGLLKLRTAKVDGRWVSGGVGSWNHKGLKYGKVDVRFRVPQGNGIAYAFLLWPANGTWPPEIDFAEDGGGSRAATSATLHYGANNTQIARSVSADFTQWHTVGVEWTPDTLVYTLDGEPWSTVRNENVPSTRMVLALQTQVWGCHVAGYTCPDASTPLSSSLDVDWVVAYERSQE